MILILPAGSRKKLQGSDPVYFQKPVCIALKSCKKSIAGSGSVCTHKMRLFFTAAGTSPAGNACRRMALTAFFHTAANLASDGIYRCRESLLRRQVDRAVMDAAGNSSCKSKTRTYDDKHGKRRF